MSKNNGSNTISDFWKLITAIAICEGTGILSGFLANAGMNPWFDSINKPSWNPPSWVFAPVWATLYLLMGISLWLIWKMNADQSVKLKALLFFAAQLFLNFWWSIIFFKFHSPALAFLDIVLLIIFILITIFKFAELSRLAAWLLVPYIAWVSFASILNYAIWSLNR